MAKPAPAAKKAKAAKKTPQPEYKSYPIRIKVISQGGHCALGHKVGDEWVYKYQLGTPDVPNICDAAMHSMIIYLRALAWGATIPAPTPDPNTFFCACPDSLNPVVFEMKRLIDEPIYLDFGHKLDAYYEFGKDKAVKVKTAKAEAAKPRSAPKKTK